MSSVSNALASLSKNLYPNARAFTTPAGGTLFRLHRALALSEERAYNDALAVMNSILPDTNNFTAADATDWERRLGIAAAPSTPLATRKQAITRKMNHPGTQVVRQHYDYIQAQLQAAGFPVTIYENKFPDGSGGYITKTPQQILGYSSGNAVHATATQHKTALHHGGQFSNKIVNSVDELPDFGFNIGSNYYSTFYVAGASLTTFVSIPVARKAEFRQLILQLKPAQTVGFLFINYV